MAEGGSSDPPDDKNNNPFTFDTFMKKKGKQPHDQDDKDDIVDIFDIPTPKKKEKNELIVTVTEDVPTKCQVIKHKPEANPFSFKHFLREAVSGGNKPKPFNRRLNTNGHSCKSVLPGPDVASDLPDFVQDHYASDAARERLGYRDVELPDFTINTTDNPRNKRVTNERPQNSVPDLNLFSDISTNRHDEFPLPHRTRATPSGGTDNGYSDLIPFDRQQSGDIFTDNLNHAAAANGGPHARPSLPDFLPDGAISGSDAVCSPSGYMPSTRRIVSGEINGDLESENLAFGRLRDENQQLRQQLDQLRQEKEVESNRLVLANQQIERIQKHEAEETAALEHMMQQVESNLTATTQRAVLAESTVAKLKQDAKSLQNQIAVLTTENEAMKSGDPTVLGIRERTKYVSEQLSTAATEAEQNLKRLLSGVDNLKLLSSVLSSIDKITDAPTTSTSTEAESEATPESS